MSQRNPLLYSLLKKALFSLEAERAHGLVSHSTETLARLLPPKLRRLGVKDSPVELCGITFPNRIGLAAGFDKSGQFLRGAQALGFGFTEVGAVTPKPQAGHPLPRMWRYPEKEVLRNRMGFNNPGVWALAKRLGDRPANFPLGVNLGKNADTDLADALKDYQAGLETLYGYADFFVVNVSSPNTAGLRSLQDELATLLRPLVLRGQELAEQFELKPRPILVKLSPDLGAEQLRGVAESALEASLDGFVAANTTSLREGEYAQIPAEGGLSGPLLHQRAVHMVSELRKLSGSGALIMGCGGVHDRASLQNFLDAGADLVQIYTGLVYEGPGLVRRLLASRLEKDL